MVSSLLFVERVKLFLGIGLLGEYAEESDEEGEMIFAL